MRVQEFLPRNIEKYKIWADNRKKSGKYMEYQKEYERNRPYTEIDKTRKWRNHIRKTYNITPEYYVEILNNQNGVCAICLNNSDTRKLHVDHDRLCCSSNKSCGKCIRSLLCGKCNSLIGLAKESITTLRNAIDYLEKHSVKS